MKKNSNSMFFLKNSKEGLLVTPPSLPEDNEQEKPKELTLEDNLKVIASFREQHEAFILSEREDNFLKVSNSLKDKLTNTLKSLNSPNLSVKGMTSQIGNDWGSDFPIRMLLQLYCGPVETERLIASSRKKVFRELNRDSFIFSKEFRENVYSTDKYLAGRYLLETLPEFLHLLYSVLDKGNYAGELAKGAFEGRYDWLGSYSYELTKLRKELRKNK